MKYIAAGLTAFVVFFMSYLLLVLVEDPVLALMGWNDLGPSHDMGWWRTGAGVTIAALAFHCVIEWRNNAALKWRKTLAARARA
ncbi:hypothetical protein [Microvirga pakistanensis]|uniref:hypothetical protein n=1 Tax=Microvirga pakistanensis TaxID=1682650 RepID=UPI00106954A2|nr:hypothetical protein [Microvirga pakistanensis]